MDNYLSRLASFFSFPFSSPVSTVSLAEAGFHYTGNKDEVVCHRCTCKYSGWQKHDDPKSIHKAISPDCTFIFKTDNGNDDKKLVSLSSGTGDKQEQGECGTEDGATGGPLGLVEEKTKVSIKQDQNFSGQQLKTVTCRETEVKTNTDLTQKESGNNLVTSPASSNLSASQVNHNVMAEQDTMSLNVPDRYTQGNHSQSPEITRTGEDFPTTVRSGYDPTIYTETRQGTDSHTSQTLRAVRPRYPQFAILSVRLASYKNWSTHLRQKPEALAKAGLFYEGTSDYVRCFHCAGGLREWEPEDDPFIEHARWFPFCDFMRLIKGDEFIIGVQSGAIKADHQEATLSESLLRSEKPGTHIQNVFDDPAVLSVMEMGYNKETISKAVQLFTARNGKTLSAEALLPIVWEIVGDDGIDSEEEDDNKLNVKVPDELHNTVHRNGEDISTCETDIEMLKEENKALRERKICKVCLDEEANIVFLPCGHLVTCPMCASALRKCPICRCFIRGTVKAIVS
ncbi:baculoviral IAP repeat-containing protein 2-like [Ylistrum balloti]|uniref:baculoviral IAP repeat-containing protein 2-like n=1 Tax=Ylistrum balloti TaxID=509963 RepID=UPI002905CED2|nr:baculoviral IAP repeat-containing protein 2-like [Ylistrum balloti]